MDPDRLTEDELAERSGTGRECIRQLADLGERHPTELADLAGISPNSFCRYFKSRTRKTYSKFLLEIRVGHACKLLIENKNEVVTREKILQMVWGYNV